MKAIWITEKNRSSIAGDYNIDLDDAEEMLPIGYILMTNFGTPWFEAIVPQATFDQYFNKGAALENEYYEASRK